MSSEIVVHENDLQDLLEEVQRDLSVLLKSDRLAKADDDKKEKKDPAAEVSPKEEAPKDAPADDSAPAAAADPVDDSAMEPAGDVTPEESAMAAPGEPAMGEPEADEMAPMDQGMGEAIEPAPSIEALQAEYEQLPENELMMHLCAAHAACLARGGLGAQPDAMAGGMDPAMAPPEAAPEMAAPAPAMPPEEPEMAPAMKGELEMKGEVNPSAGDGCGDDGWKEGGGLKKSAADLKVEALEAKVADQEKALMELVNFATTPFRKSVKNLSEVKDVSIPDPVSMNKTELRAKLLEQSKNPELKKSDRALINGYYEGTVKVEQLEHLLKVKG